MFNNITQAYNLGDATIEILTMVVIAWILGFLLGRLTKNCPCIHGDSNTVMVEKTVKNDNLKVVEGIGPKIEKLLNKAGIRSFEELSDTSSKKLKSILDDAGSMFQMHNPKTWPDQAELAMQGNWGELKEYQDLLIAGRDS